MTVSPAWLSGARVSLRPNWFERVLALGAILLLVALAWAVMRGRPKWDQAPLLVWLHLATIAASLALTPVLLLRPRGVRRHRQVGYAWVAAMTATAALSFGIRTIHPGGFSPIHVLSTLTLITAPLLAWFAHAHNVRAHRMTALFLVTGALVIAGFFTFPFGRMLGRWLLG